MLIEGTFAEIDIKNCTDVVISRGRTRLININNSTVTIENSIVDGNDVGINVSNSKVSITGSRISADTAVKIKHSQVDFAGTVLKGRTAALVLVESSQYSTQKSVDIPATPVLFSVSRAESPGHSGTLHGVIKLTAQNPL